MKKLQLAIIVLTQSLRPSIFYSGIVVVVNNSFDLTLPSVLLAQALPCVMTNPSLRVLESDSSDS